MNTLLEPYRKIIRPLMDDPDTATVTFRQAAQQATLKLWGWTADLEVSNPAKHLSMISGSGLLVTDQVPALFPRLKKAGVDPRQLTLLNETYEIDGDRFQLGNMTPKEVRDKLLPKLVEQQSALNRKVREIRKLLKACRFDNRLIIDQV